MGTAAELVDFLGQPQAFNLRAVPLDDAAQGLIRVQSPPEDWRHVVRAEDLGTAAAVGARKGIAGEGHAVGAQLRVVAHDLATAGMVFRRAPPHTLADELHLQFHGQVQEPAPRGGRVGGLDPA